MSTTDFMGGDFMIAIWLLAIFIAILWTFLPFAIFGFQKKMDEQIALQRKTNELLEDLLIHQSEMSGIEIEVEDSEVPIYDKKFRDPDKVAF